MALWRLLGISFFLSFRVIFTIRIRRVASESFPVPRLSSNNLNQRFRFAMFQAKFLVSTSL